MGQTPSVDETTTVLVGKSGGRLHLTADSGPRCAMSGDFSEKPLSVYPPAHREWCQTCLSLWRQSGAFAHGDAD
ncbi:hypothetical protein [Haladaptatus sp. CMSO5]|uniref:hypothetical protein n=1 Tax=Haladaptatus sp. CMSO5 TaxID=3120514 RepID=UPI002FCE65E8